MEHLLVGRICRCANRIRRVRLCEVFDVREHGTVRILSAAQLTNIGRDTGVDERNVCAGVGVHREGAEDEEPAACVELFRKAA